MLAHGSCMGNASPSCNNSTEIWSGERTNAMRPSLYEGFGFVVEGRMIGEFQEMDGSKRDNVMMALFV